MDSENKQEDEVEVFDHTSEIEIPKEDETIETKEEVNTPTAVVDNTGNMESVKSITLQQVVGSSDGVINPATIEPIADHREIKIGSDDEEVDVTDDIVRSNLSSLKNPNGKPRISESELLFAFIGKKYQNFVTKEFNFMAFIFTSGYLLFRKMYFYSFIVTLIPLVAAYFIKNPLLLLLIYLVIGFVLGLSINKLYLRFSRNKIENIRFKNPFLDNDALTKKCASSGGVSIISVIIGSIVNSLIITLLLGVYLYFIQKVPLDGLYNKIMEIYQGITVDTTDSEFNGVIIYNTEINIKDEYTVIVPMDFKKGSDSTDSILDYEYASGLEECSFKFASVNNYKNASKFADGVKKHYESDDKKITRGTTTINGIVWEKVEFDFLGNHVYYYATNKDNRMYLLRYEMGLKEDNSCSKYHDQLINSIKVKEKDSK